MITDGNTYLIDVTYKSRWMVGMVTNLQSRGYYRVWIAGVCNMSIQKSKKDNWQIMVGLHILPDVLNAIGSKIELMYEVVAI